MYTHPHYLVDIYFTSQMEKTKQKVLQLKDKIHERHIDSAYSLMHNACLRTQQTGPVKIVDMYARNILAEISRIASL